MKAVDSYCDNINYWRNKCILLERDKQGLIESLAKVEKRLTLEQQQQHGFVVIADKPVPIHIVRWMSEHDLPWECFWCYAHQEWVNELDTSFPHYMDNTCHHCKL